VRSARVFAWSLAAVSAALTALDTVLVAVSVPLLSAQSVGIHGWPLVNAASLASAVLGAVIVSSDSRHPIGWLLTFVGVTTCISLAAESYGVWVLEHGGHGSISQGQVAAWVAAVLGGQLALTCITLVFLLVPTGSFLTPRWRWVMRAAGAGYVVQLVALVGIGPSGFDRRGDPIHVGAVTGIMLIGGFLLILLSVLASVACMLVRLQRSHGVVRQQLRMVAAGAASVGVGLLILIVGQALNGGQQSWWSSVPLFLAYAFLLTCIAVAVLRYRLYDVELILGRAVVLATATAFVAVCYVGLVVVLGRSAQDRTDGGFWVSLLLTVVVALAFQPLRRRVVRFADRLAYGSRAAPYDALADFSHRIGQSPAPGTLLPTIAAAAAGVVHADRAVVSFDVEGGADLTAVWPPTAPDVEPDDGTVDDAVMIPVQDRQGALGSIRLDVPPGRDVRVHERRLLSDIAEQAALAFRNARLQVELAARVKQLDQRTKELTASRNRIIGAGDTERERLESALGQQVLPAMKQLRVELEEAARRTPDAGAIAAFADQATEALESLRELTRGIFPTMLPRSGLGPALAAYVSRVERQDVLTIDSEVMESRYSDRVEAAAYFCCIEALGHATGHLDIAIAHDGADLVLRMHGVDLAGMDRLAVLDRVEACEGSLEVVRMHGQSSVRITLPRVPADTPVSVG
jgi:signal transduction histidine kinase